VVAGELGVLAVGVLAECGGDRMAKLMAGRGIYGEKAVLGVGERGLGPDV